MQKQNTLLLRPTKIDAIRRVEKKTICYDITVDIDHTFFIRHNEKNILTHNCEPPDIDSDLGDRDLVIEGLRERFGKDNVIPVSNYNSLQLKSLTKDISKFYGIPFDEANAGTATVEQDVRAAIMGVGDDKNLFELKYDDALKHSQTYREYLEKYPHVAENIQVLHKQVRSIGRHAGGVIIGENLEKAMPIIAVKGEAQTPWVEGTAVKHLNEYGIIKYDLLGLETLRFIQKAIEHIIRRHGTYKLTIEGKQYELSGNHAVILSDGSERKVRDLKPDDDITDLRLMSENI